MAIPLAGGENITPPPSPFFDQGNIEFKTFHKSPSSIRETAVSKSEQTTGAERKGTDLAEKHSQL